MLNGKSVLLGISGGIAAYKAAELVRLLVKDGAGVHVVMTANAQRFIAPLTLQALSGNPVGTDLFSLESESRIGHIHLARAADLVILAPATANLIAKMAAGIADDYLTTILLATTAPILVCPAMNVKMYDHPMTRRNLNTLREFNHHIVEPEVGELACKEEGTGRLAEPSAIVEAARRLLTPASLAGKRILISAGPTWEAFDPVRFISNPSSGKMGYALASVAYRRAAEVFLVSGPSSLPTPHGIHFQKVTTAYEMRDIVVEHATQMDVIVMAAAVGDYRPLQVAPHKMKKLQDELNVALVRNPDILGQLGRSRGSSRRPILIGFAAETENLIENATEKLVQKNLDFIVANNLTQRGSGFGCDTNQVKIIDRRGTVTELPPLTKEEVAEQVFDRVEALLGITES
jgi:phosphopantothenoylcysteine decarboxylase / phosphopantothenate---cysteine ligase